MYKIISKGDGRNFECALQFFITDKSQYYLYGASFAGFPSAAWAVDAALCSMNRVKIVTDEQFGESEYIPTGSLRHIEKKVDRLVHILMLPKASLFMDTKDTNVQAVVVNWDNTSIEKAIGEYLAKHFDLPWELADKYHELFYVEELEVISDPALGSCPVKAARIGVSQHDFTLTPEKVDAVISDALRSGRLKIPRTLAQGKYTEGQSLQEYLKANAQVFATQVSQVKPFYDPAEVTKLDPAIIMKRIPFPAQAHAIQALVNLLKITDTAKLCGVMGIGSVCCS